MSEPTLRQLSERVTQLEEEVQRLKSKVCKDEQPEKPWWEKIAGRHKNSEVFAEIVRLGREIREAERPKERGSGVKRKKVPARQTKREAAKR